MTTFSDSQRTPLNISAYSPVRCKSMQIYNQRKSFKFPSLFIVPGTSLSPKSPRNDPLGIHQKVRTILKSIIENHNKWKLAQKRGVTLCSTIENIKKQALDKVANEPFHTLYPDDLKVPSEKLKIITTILKDVLDSDNKCLRELIALKKLRQDLNEKVLKTWSMDKIIKSVEIVVKAYEDEYDVKVKVMENVCHSSTKEEIVTHVSFWEFETFVNDDIRFLVLSMQVECDFEQKI